MFRRSLVALATLLFSTALFAQSAPSDVEQRLRALEEKVAAMQKAAPTVDFSEIQREIDVLSKEIETLKAGGEKSVVAADANSHGLGVAASKVYRADRGVSFGGYGEFLYNNPQHDVATADALRAILYTGYKFNDRVLFNSELEVEHASTESAGAVSLEFGYLDFLMNPRANVRAGLVLVPMGIINEQHEPTAYLGARKPLTEQFIIPATWSEIGAGVFGDVGTISYRGYVMTGLDSAAFTTAEGLREGRQGGSEAVAEDLAAVGRLDWRPIEGTMIGGSLYSGGSGQTASFRGNVTLAEVHVDSKFRGFSLRGLAARGRLGDAGEISAANGEVIGSRMGGWYVEAGYDLLGLAGGRAERSLTPYVRYESLDTQKSVPRGFLRDGATDQNIFTLGVAFRPIPQTVLKVDWQKVDNRAKSGADQFNVALGYIF